MRSVLAVGLALALAACGAKTALRTPQRSRSIDGGTSTERDATIARDAPVARDVEVPADAPGTYCGGMRLTLGVGRTPIVLVLDASASMSMRFTGGGMSRWDTLVELLADIRDDLHFSGARFGLAVYQSVPECPTIRWQSPDGLGPSVDLRRVWLEGRTPTAEAIDDVVRRLAADGPILREPPVLLLATDGEPTGCEGADAPRADAVAAVRRAFDLGIETYVVSVGDEIAVEHLTAVADAGRGLVGPPHATFWVALERRELARALTTIVEQNTYCRVALPGPIDPARACDAVILFDGVRVPCGLPDGYAIRGATLTFNGRSCADAPRARTITGAFPCGPGP